MKNKLILGSLLTLIITAGCSTGGDYQHTSGTAVNLNGNNYKILKPGVEGHSTGFKLLGLVPLYSPSYAEAKADIYKSFNEPFNGRSIALANQTEDRSTIYLILFSLPKITITADVIEFTGNTNHVAQ